MILSIELLPRFSWGNAQVVNRLGLISFVLWSVVDCSIRY